MRHGHAQHGQGARGHSYFSTTLRWPGGLTCTPPPSPRRPRIRVTRLYTRTSPGKTAGSCEHSTLRRLQQRGQFGWIVWGGGASGRTRYGRRRAPHWCISLYLNTKDTMTHCHGECCCWFRACLLLDALGVSWTLPERGGARDEHPGQGEGDHKEPNVHLSVGSGRGAREGWGGQGRGCGERSTTGTRSVRRAGRRTKSWALGRTLPEERDHETAPPADCSPL